MNRPVAALLYSRLVAGERTGSIAHDPRRAAPGGEHRLRLNLSMGFELE
jgi:hypothetical protein